MDLTSIFDGKAPTLREFQPGLGHDAGGPVRRQVRGQDMIRYDLSTAALAALLVRPVPNLKTALHHGHTALGEMLADKRTSLPPDHHWNR